MNYAAALKEILTQAAPLLSSADQKEWLAKPSPERWSKQEILGHLIDSAYNNHRRFIQASLQDDLCFDGYDQVAWVAQNRYQTQSIQEVVNTWKSANDHLATLIAGITPDVLERQTTNHNFHIIGMQRPQEGQPASLGYLIHDYLFHVEHHLAQVLPTYERRIPSQL